jgi:hypothetical protein
VCNWWRLFTNESCALNEITTVLFLPSLQIYNNICFAKPFHGKPLWFGLVNNRATHLLNFTCTIDFQSAQTVKNNFSIMHTTLNVRLLTKHLVSTVYVRTDDTTLYLQSHQILQFAPVFHWLSIFDVSSNILLLPFWQGHPF